MVVTLATRAWRVTGKLGDFGREREKLWHEDLEGRVCFVSDLGS